MLSHANIFPLMAAMQVGMPLKLIYFVEFQICTCIPVIESVSISERTFNNLNMSTCYLMCTRIKESMHGEGGDKAIMACLLVLGLTLDTVTDGTQERTRRLCILISMSYNSRCLLISIHYEWFKYYVLSCNKQSLVNMINSLFRTLTILLSSYIKFQRWGGGVIILPI